MRLGKHIELLKTFSAEEIVIFEKFLQSPYFNSRDIISYFRIITRHFPQFPDECTSAKHAFAKLYPKKKYNEKKIINLNYFLVKLIEEFLIQKGLEKRSYEKKYILLSELFDRKLFNYLGKKLETDLLNLESESGSGESLLLARRSANYLRASLSLELQNYSGLFENKERMQEHLSALFLIKYFEHLRDMYVAENTYNIRPGSLFIQKLIDAFDSEKFMSSLKREDKYFVPLKFAYLAYRSASDFKNDNHYFELKKLFLENFKTLNRTEKYFRLSELISFCTVRFNEPDSIFVKEMFGLVKFGLKNRIHKFSDDDYFQIASFRNVVLLCSRLGECKWLRSFIEKYSGELNPAYAEGVKLLAYSKLYFSMEEFEKSLECIAKIDYDFFLFKIDIKEQMLINFYELRMYEQAISLIDSYRHFLSRSKEYSDGVKRSARNFLNQYSNILRAKMSNDMEKFSEIENELSKMVFFPNKDWILMKIDQAKRCIE